MLKHKLKNSEILIQTILSFIIRMLGAISAFILSVIIGRELGVEESGYYFLAFSVVMFLSSISRLGLDNTILRFTGAAYQENDYLTMSSVLSKSVLLTFICSLFFACLLFSFSNELSVQIFSKPLLAPVLQGMSFGIVGLALLTLVSMSLQGLRCIPKSIFTANISVNMMLIFTLLMYGLESSEEAAIIFSFASVFTAVLGAFLWQQSVKKLNYQDKAEGGIKWQMLFNSCLPLWIVMMMTQLTLWSGQFIAGIWLSAEDFAQLAVAQRTALLTSFILMAVNMVVAPRFSALYKQGKSLEMRRLALISVRLMLLFAVPIIGMMLMYPEFLMSFFGEGFSSGAHLLQILAVGQFINVATGSVSFLLSMSGHEKDLRNITLLSAPIAVCVALLLVPLYGATGSAIATALAIATQNLLAVYWVKKRFGFNTMAIWVKI